MKTRMLSTQNSTSHQPPKYMKICKGSEVKMGLERAEPESTPIL
jgi:hypothetical protein